MRAAGWALIAALLAPIVLSVAVSFTPSRFLELPTSGWTLKWYAEFFAQPRWLPALWTSLAVAGLTAVVSVLAALGAAVALEGRRSAWARTAEFLLLTPLVLPAVALALGLLVLVRQTPLWGSAASLVLAHSVIAAPPAYLVLRAGVAKLDPHLAWAARGLGANPWQVFRHVTAPLLAPSLATAAVFAAVVSLHEVPLALFLATRETETLPRLIWPAMRFAISPLVAAASTILLAGSLPAIALGAWWFRRRNPF